MITVSQQPIDFVLLGTVARFKVGKHQRIRHFDLVSDQGRYRFKVPHHLHRHCNLQLREGDEVRVSGSVRIDPRKRRMKLKLQGLQVTGAAAAGQGALKVVTELGALQALDPRSSGSDRRQPARPIQRILVCQASSCWKQGGREIYQRLQDSAAAMGDEGTIRVETTGCMGRCKSAPNVKLMPEKITHRAVQPADVRALIHGCLSA